jgi:hypothetical protein
MTFILKLKSPLFDDYVCHEANDALKTIEGTINQMVEQRVRMEVTAFAHLVGEGFANGGTIEEFQGFKNDLIANYPDMSTFDYWAFWRKANENTIRQD